MKIMGFLRFDAPPAAAHPLTPAHVSGQNFDPFAFQKPRLGHKREKALLFILVWLGARCSAILSDHVKILYPHRDALVYPTHDPLYSTPKKSFFKSADETLRR